MILTEERLIWRPNEVSPDEWDRLSRDGQIHWWRDHIPPTKPRPHPLRAISLYQEGTTTRSEIPIFVFEKLTEDNVGEFIAGCPEAVQEILQLHAEQLPADDDEDGWSHPWVSAEDIRRAEAESNRRYREGVRMFRGHDGSTPR